MPNDAWLYAAFVLCAAASALVLVSLRREHKDERARLAPQPAAPAPRPLRTALPLWLEQFAEIGFETLETNDTSFLATVKNVGYAIVVSQTHEDKTCKVCHERAIRTLGETGAAADVPDERRTHEVTWIGWACGNCGTVDRSQRNPARFLGLMLADGSNVFDVLQMLQNFYEMPFEERVMAALQGREDQMHHQMRLSALLRHKIQASIPTAQVIPFERKFRKVKGHLH